MVAMRNQITTASFDEDLEKVANFVKLLDKNKDGLLSLEESEAGVEMEKEGDGYERTVLVQFDSLDQAQRCYNSDEYADALQFSKKSSKRLVVLVDCIDV